jgi:uracil-DNA glycosylase
MRPDRPPPTKAVLVRLGPGLPPRRVSGSARLLGIETDPGPTERVACRTLVGDAGQRVQGFLSKLGLTRSYVLVNAHPFALHPGEANRAKPLLAKPAHRDWRNGFYDAIAGPKLQAVVALGDQAQEALRLWSPPKRGRAVRGPAPEQPQ